MKHTLKSNGSIAIDKGAVGAVTKNGASLLPSGLSNVTGHFAAGESINITDSSTGKIIAKGISQYGSRDLSRIQGYKSDEIVDILGCCPSKVVIHRDDMVLV